MIFVLIVIVSNDDITESWRAPPPVAQTFVDFKLFIWEF